MKSYHQELKQKKYKMRDYNIKFSPSGIKNLEKLIKKYNEQMRKDEEDAILFWFCRNA
tara:strand:+ start:397 stop:570 length:174 start_codon:yes stop_codon:yes gene_type:complete